MEIRKLESKDVKAVAGLVVKAMAPQFKKVGESFLTTSQYAAKLSEAIKNMEFGIVMEDKGAIVGFAHWYYQDNQAFIEDLVTSSAGQRFGKALANFVFKTCKNDRVQSVSFLLPHGSPDLDFATKAGLKPVSVELKKIL